MSYKRQFSLLKAVPAAILSFHSRNNLFHDLLICKLIKHILGFYFNKAEKSNWDLVNIGNHLVWKKRKKNSRMNNNDNCLPCFFIL